MQLHYRAQSVVTNPCGLVCSHLRYRLSGMLAARYILRLREYTERTGHGGYTEEVSTFHAIIPEGQSTSYFGTVIQEMVENGELKE